MGQGARKELAFLSSHCVLAPAPWFLAHSLTTPCSPLGLCLCLSSPFCLGCPVFFWRIPVRQTLPPPGSLP